MAAKPPSFPFYGQDFQTGTMAMTPAERGVYIDCLWFQWANGGVPADDVRRLAQVMRCTPAEAKKHWSVVAPKFVKGDDGLYRNVRLETVRADKQAWHESRKNNGGKGGRPAKQVCIVETTEKPSGSENANLVVPLSLSSSSEPTVQRDAGAPASLRSFGDPNNMATDRNAAASIFVGDGRIVSVPSGWATKACREYGLTLTDIDAFASWASADAKRNGFEDGGKRLQWLDVKLAAYRAEKARPNDGLRPAQEWIDEYQKTVAEVAEATAKAKADGTYRTFAQIRDEARAAKRATV